MSEISASVEDGRKKSLEVPEEPDTEESHSEDDTGGDRRCSLTFYTAARHDSADLKTARNWELAFFCVWWIFSLAGKSNLFILG
jgi:hypothetical protein